MSIDYVMRPGDPELLASLEALDLEIRSLNDAAKKADAKEIENCTNAAKP